MFSICKEKEHNFQKHQNIALLYLNLRKKITKKCSIFYSSSTGTLESKNANRLFSLLVAKSTPWSQAFLAEMLETGDENREPPLIGLPLSLISHYFFLLKYLDGGTKAEIFA